ncbi:MAG: hypothetical protein KatS3mg132_053 [Limisphaera sp.]|nr:MAG: hypothetical protein KatS3mg132_053 [Limisphaera sp.]
MRGQLNRLVWPSARACSLPAPWQFSHWMLARFFSCWRQGVPVGRAQRGREGPAQLRRHIVKAVVHRRRIGVVAHHMALNAGGAVVGGFLAVDGPLEKGRMGGLLPLLILVLRNGAATVTEGTSMSTQICAHRHVPLQNQVRLSQVHRDLDRVLSGRGGFEQAPIGHVVVQLCARVEGRHLRAERALQPGCPCCRPAGASAPTSQRPRHWSCSSAGGPPGRPAGRCPPCPARRRPAGPSGRP